MPTKETTSQDGELGARAHAAEVGAWGAMVGAGEAVSASLVRGEGAFSAGKERSSNAN